MEQPDITGDVNNFYDVLVHYQTHIADSKKVKLGNKGKCRFCSNEDLKNFKKTAHTIPEFLGNKRIINLDECDNCNKIFSRYEDELSRFLSPYLTMGQIRGKRGIPKIKGAGFEFKRDEKRISFSISNQEPNDVILYNPLNDSIQLKAVLPKHKFIPRHAYKALCKVALSILPQEELQNFTKLLKWIREPNDLEDFHYLECKLSQTEMYRRLPLVGAYVLKRKGDTAEVPYMIFVLMASTFCLQIDLMSDEKDNHIDFLASKQIQISKNIILGNGSEQVQINYRDEIRMNWASSEKTTILLDSMSFNIPRSDFIKSAHIIKNQQQ
jgi:hypothetical protein